MADVFDIKINTQTFIPIYYILLYSRRKAVKIIDIIFLKWKNVCDIITMNTLTTDIF